MYYYNFIMGWSLFFLALISFVSFMYLFGGKEPKLWKGLCAFVLAIFFIIPSSHFLRINLRAHIVEEVRLDKQVEVCGFFMRMDGGDYYYNARSWGRRKYFAVFLIEKQELRFGDFFYDTNGVNTKDIIMSLKKDDPVCVQYVTAPFPRRSQIIVKVSR